MRRKTIRIVLWGTVAVLSSSLLVMAGVWIGDQTGGGGRQKAKLAEGEAESDFENRLLGEFAAEFENAGDAEQGERAAAMKILREADPLLSRIKRQNREAMRRANQHPRIVPPKKTEQAPPPSQSDDPPEGNDAPE